jgi:hypothetical protein
VKILKRRSNEMMLTAIVLEAQLNKYCTNSTYMEWIA